MEWFSFVTPITGLNTPNTGKEDDDDDYVCICQNPTAFFISVHVCTFFLSAMKYKNRGKEITV
jgi:hypothetical protein